MCVCDCVCVLCMCVCVYMCVCLCVCAPTLDLRQPIRLVVVLRGAEGGVEEDEQQNQPIESHRLHRCATVPAADPVPAPQRPAGGNTPESGQGGSSVPHCVRAVNSPAADLHHLGAERKHRVSGVFRDDVQVT